MEKKLVFISHISSEREIALAFKLLIEEAFLGMIDVFVSSDPLSLPMGGRWLNDITDALKRCEVEIVFASSASIEKPWINFEAGAGWIRDVSVIPICHSGMTLKTLSPPLNNLMGATATNAEQLENVFMLLAKTLECKLPAVNYEKFIDTVKRYEKVSTEIEKVASKSPVLDKSGLKVYEFATLEACANAVSSPSHGVEIEKLKESMNESWNPVTANMGIASLERRGLVEIFSEEVYYHNTLQFCKITPLGWSYLEENSSLIKLEKLPQPPRAPHSNSTPPPDEIPF